MRRLSAIILALGGLAATGALAREVTPAEKRVIPYSADLPACEDPAVLTEVTNQFAEKEADYWKSPLRIVGYENPQPLAFRPWGLDTIPRRFCTATATTSDGRRRRVDYSVREDLDFIGVGWGIEFCVAGLDRNLAYSPACRMARP